MNILYYFQDEFKLDITENNLFELMTISNCLTQQYDIWKNNKDITETETTTKENAKTKGK